MAVLSVKTFKAHPGKMDALIQLLHDARTEMLRVDPNRTVRIFQPLEGPDIGNVSIMIEYANMESFQKIRAKEQADRGWQAIGERANGPDRPAETVSYVQMTEL